MSLFVQSHVISIDTDVDLNEKFAMKLGCMDSEICRTKSIFTIIFITCTAMTAGGFTKVSGIFYKVFATVFDADTWYIGLMVSLKDASLFLLAPLASALSIRFGHVTVICIGSIITSAGLFISAFMPNIHHLIISFGFVTGKYQY